MAIRTLAISRKRRRSDRTGGSVTKKRKTFFGKHGLNHSQRSGTGNAGDVVPNRMFVKLPYNDYRSYTSAATGAQVYRLNSIFDPDYTGAGHQPLGHDQWAALYRRYKVYGVTVEFQVCNESAEPAMVAVFPEPNSAVTTTSMNILQERPDGVGGLLSGSLNEKISFKRYYSMKNLFGRDIDDDDFGAAFAADPLRVQYLHVNWEAVNGSSSLAIDTNVKLTFHCELSEPKVLSAS